MRVALYPGTFDPFTYGHLDVLERGLRVVDHIEITVAINASKKTLFSIEKRCDRVQASIKHLDNVSVVPFEGLLVKHAEARNAACLLRGLRQVSDFDYEFRMAFANRRLAPDLETIFLMTSEEHFMVSSSIVRDVHYWGGDLSTFVPPPVLKALSRKPTAQNP